MNAQLREKAIKLRLDEELSYSAIQKRLGVPKSTLSYWLKEFPLSEEKILELRRKGWEKGEASRERFRATMRKKREERGRALYEKWQKRFVNLSEESHFVAGLMLYLAEGGKTAYARIVFTNTDPGIICFFVNWMTKFLEIPPDRIKVGLHLYENMDIQKEMDFWKGQLGFSANQFYKPQVRKIQKSSFSYRSSFGHGTCAILFGSVEKKLELTMAIQALLDYYKMRSGV